MKSAQAHSPPWCVMLGEMVRFTRPMNLCAMGTENTWGRERGERGEGERCGREVRKRGVERGT